MPEGFLDDFRKVRTSCSMSPANSRQRYYITDKATLQSCKGKDAGEVDWDTLAERWDATIGGERATPARPLALNSNRPQSIHNSLGDCRCQMEGLGPQKNPLQYWRASHEGHAPIPSDASRSQEIMKSIFHGRCRPPDVLWEKALAEVDSGADARG
jgi:hypothetical protein